MKYAIVTVLALSACAPSVAPVVSEYNGNSVSIQIDGAAAYMPKDKLAVLKQQANAEAQRICQKGGKRTAEYISARYTPTGQYTGYVTRLYICG